MKGAILALAFGAFAAVHASEDEKKPTPAEGGAAAQPEGAAPEDISAIFNAEGGKIDWNSFSPEALGMQLNYDEMSTEELEKVIDAFVRLGLISPEERESFGASLVDPVMRSMIQTVNENWPATMEKIMKDPEYLNFLKGFQNNIDEAALATIVGLKEGLPGALRDRENNTEDKQ
ncbi:hypothetical protein, conserved [Eimeria maxima]|uniref:Eimeria-specific protein n=1 Tax=Eimeria maxima TaxID=5804 RepID=G3LUS8_EIMMA|nr:hypothetical protein, conserved [Eimeria maxima]AEN84770.1 Eimeria-specific protein [Eimeria maxima]CDJ59663.1 hypothetical protein, conserved [Eimeria maxima]